MSQEVGRDVETFVAATGDGLVEMLCVPVDDDCGEEVQHGHAEVLAFAGAIAEFALPADAECTLQSVMGLALVEADLGAALHVGIEQPVDDEERP